MTAAAPPVDERILVAGTTVRFVQLIILLLATSAGMAVETAIELGDTGASGGCFLAAGGNPESPSTESIVGAVGQHYETYLDCVDQHVQAPPTWAGLAWPVLVLVIAAFVLWILPRWRVRRRGVVELDAVEGGTAIRAELDDLADRAGLTSLPRIVVDDAESTSAVVFGTDRRPVVLLHGGLLALRTSRPEVFKAVVLHEFAHITGRDVTVTYSTVALWRTFIAVALVPYVALTLVGLYRYRESFSRSADVMMDVRDLSLAFALTALVYLVRSDVLRSREFYADLAAQRCGAELRGLELTEPAQPSSRLRLVGGRIAEAWRTHPSWALRQRALGDTSVLFAVRAMPIFLAGVAAVLIGDQLANVAPGFSTGWLTEEDFIAFGSAALVTAVAGIVLWRGTVHAALTRAQAPSGVRAGLWLGAGMVLGELIRHRVNDFQWIPSRPDVLLLLLLAGAAFGWWTVQCASLWLGTWRGRTIIPVMLLVLVGGWLALSAWFGWWNETGVTTAGGDLVDSAAVARALAQGLGADGAEHSAAFVLIAGTIPPMSDLAVLPLAWVAVAAAWSVPLLAWTIRTADADPLWVRRRHPGGSVRRLPPLRPILYAAVAGGLAGVATMVAAMAHMHRLEPPLGERGTAEVMLVMAWSIVALAAASLVASMAASTAMRRHRLIAALIAGQIATSAAFIGVLALLAADGCVEVLSSLQPACSGASFRVVVPVLRQFALLVFVVTALLSGIVAALVAFAAKVVRHGELKDPADRRAGFTRRVVPAALCAVAAGFTLSAEVIGARAVTTDGDSGIDWLDLTVTEAGAEPSQRVRAAQVFSWNEYGGLDLVGRMVADIEDLGAAVVEAGGDIEVLDQARVREDCVDIIAVVDDAEQYFPIPDEETQAAWARFLEQAREAAEGCVFGIDHDNPALLGASIVDFGTAAETVLEVYIGIEAVMVGDLDARVSVSLGVGRIMGH